MVNYDTIDMRIESWMRILSIATPIWADHRILTQREVNSKVGTVFHVQKLDLVSMYVWVGTVQIWLNQMTDPSHLNKAAL